MAYVRKIDYMHKRFGVVADRCKNCSNLCQMAYRGKTYYKCLVYGNTQSEATDWRLSYMACGMLNQEYKGTPIIEMAKRQMRVASGTEPIEGQISMEVDNG